MTNSIQRISLFLVAHLFTIGCNSTPNAAIDEAEHAEVEPTVSRTDFNLIELVLVDLMDFKEFEPNTFPGVKGSKLVLIEKTNGSSWFISDDQMNGESRDDKNKLVPPDISADLRRRNQGQPFSWSGFVPRNSNLIVEDLSGTVEGDEAAIKVKYPDARGSVGAWMPGYSKDRKMAVVRVAFSWSIHSATATYMLVSQNGRWKVKWRRTAYYL